MRLRIDAAKGKLLLFQGFAWIASSEDPRCATRTHRLSDRRAKRKPSYYESAKPRVESIERRGQPIQRARSDYDRRDLSLALPDWIQVRLEREIAEAGVTDTAT